MVAASRDDAHAAEAPVDPADDGYDRNACDARCDMIARGYREVTGREPDAAALRTAYDSGFDEAQLRAYLCGRPDRQAGRCATGVVSAPRTPLERFLSYLPLNSRLGPP
jgi:hypothetical protein